MTASLDVKHNQGGRTWQAFGGGKHGHETFIINPHIGIPMRHLFRVENIDR